MVTNLHSMTREVPIIHIVGWQAIHNLREGTFSNIGGEDVQKGLIECGIAIQCKFTGGDLNGNIARHRHD